MVKTAGWTAAGIAGALLALGGTLAAPAAAAQPLVYTVQARHAPATSAAVPVRTWVPGHWERAGHGRVWVQGHWVVAQHGPSYGRGGHWDQPQHWRAGRGRDQDRDGIRDRHDRDLDGDGVPNRRDHDRDGDGIANWHDRAPDHGRRH